jgi:hypothetical protein
MATTARSKGGGAVMTTEQIQVRLFLPPGDDADPNELDELTRSLRREILELPVEDVVGGSADHLPAGAKGVDAATLGTLLVTMAGSGGLLVAVVETVRSWLTNRITQQRVVLELGENRLELSSATPAERQELIRRFLDTTTRG